MKITRKNIDALVVEVNKAYAPFLKEDWKGITVIHNSSYHYPYRLRVLYKENSGVSDLGDRMNAREIYYFLKGLLHHSIWMFLKSDNTIPI